MNIRIILNIFFLSCHSSTCTAPHTVFVDVLISLYFYFSLSLFFLEKREIQLTAPYWRIFFHYFTLCIERERECDQTKPQYYINRFFYISLKVSTLQLYMMFNTTLLELSNDRFYTVSVYSLIMRRYHEIFDWP